MCREASNCSSLHPFGRFSSPSGRSSVFDQASRFLSKHRYEKIAATVQMTWYPIRTRSSLRQVTQFKSRRSDASLHGPDVHASDMKIVCIRSAVRTTVPPVYMEITCSGRATVQTTMPHRSDATLKQERSLAKFLKFRSYSCPSGRPMAIVRTAPSFIKPDAHLSP
jgi:hypothetical protein